MKTWIRFLLAVILFGVVFTPTSVAAQDFYCSNVNEIPLLECEALVALYNSTNGPGWTDHTNWLVSNTPSNWYGVTVEEGHVTWLNFSTFTGSGFIGNNLSGPIPPEIGNLTSLKELYFMANNLTGSIPAEIANLTYLGNLFLQDNQLSGSIPPELGSMWRLFQLGLSGNQLTGGIPIEFRYLINLSALVLDNNQLSGSIPPELGDLYRRLFSLALDNNQFTGGIPPELGKLTNLWVLYLDNNQLSGTIPPELGNLQNLERLGLNGNSLSGTIPLNFINLNSLAEFDFSQTTICEPNNPDFFAWKETVPYWYATGDICTTPLYSISGQVTDESGQPLAGVDILCNGQYYDKTVTTGADGAYLCDNLPPDMYLVEHTQSSIQSDVDLLNLRPFVYGWYFLDQNKTQQDFRAVSFNGTYYGVIKDSQTSLPIANASVKLGGSQPVTTNLSGEYSISALGGDYVLTVSAPGYITKKQVVTVLTGLSLEKNVSLVPYPTNVYRLPYPANRFQKCTQGNNGSFSHDGTDKYAFDFGGSYNDKYQYTSISTVVAVREGKVMQVKTDGVAAGITAGCGSKGNYVLIKHPDGRASLYLHLKSVSVKVGDRVASGQPIGIAGNTGCSTGIHLHFQLEQYISGRWYTQSVPIKFYDVTHTYRWDSVLKKYVVVSTSNGVPISRYYYKSGNLYPLSLSLQLFPDLEALIEEDITAPEGSAVFQLTGTSDYLVSLTAFDYESENLEMRAARSAEALELLPWIPFEAEISWDYPMIYVQYRDEIGNVSETYSAFVESVGYEQPVLDFTTNAVVCTNQEIGLINQTTPYCEQCGWLWEFGNGQTSTDMQPYFDDTWEGGFAGYSDTGEYTLSMTMNTATGQYSTTKAIEVFQTPGNGILVSRSNLTVDVTSIEEAAQDWIWDFGDGTVEHGRIVSHTYNSQDDFPPYITLRVVSENGCENYNYVEIPNEVKLFLPVTIR